MMRLWDTSHPGTLTGSGKLSRSQMKALMCEEPCFDDIMCSLIATGKQPKGIIREARKVIALARRFNQEVAAPAVLEIDRRGQEDHTYLPWEYVQAANAHGFYTLFLPKMFGGRGYSLSCIGYFLEELATTCVGMANLVGVHYLGVTLLFATWNMKVASRICQEVVEGEKTGQPCLLSLAMTEPDAGTDSQNIECMDHGNLGCHARRADGGYVINGTKIFISMGHLSTWHLVQVYTDLSRASENMVTLAVKTGTPGFSFGKQERKMGQKASTASELVFKDCFVPDENVCLDSRIAAGLKRSVKATNEQVFAYVWAASRSVGVAAFGVGAARGAFETALDFARTHQVEGEPLINHQWCQGMLAEMYKNVAIGRCAYNEANYANGLHGLWKPMNNKLLYYLTRFTPTFIMQAIFRRLCQKDATNKLFYFLTFNQQTDAEIDRVDGWGSLAKVIGTDVGIINGRMALELMGRAGVRQDRRAEKIIRDAKLLQIYEGTNEVNRINLFKRLVARTCPGASVFSATNC